MHDTMIQVALAVLYDIPNSKLISGPKYDRNSLYFGLENQF